MPRLMQRDDLMRTAVDLGRAQEVWSGNYDSVSGEISFSLPRGGSYQVIVMRLSPVKATNCAKREIRYGLMKDKLKGWNYEEDRALDEEVCGMFDCLKENA